MDRPFEYLHGIYYKDKGKLKFKDFWAKKYKAIFMEMLLISSLLLFSFIFLRFNSLILSLGIIITNLARFKISTKIANEY